MKRFFHKKKSSTTPGKSVDSHDIEVDGIQEQSTKETAPILSDVPQAGNSDKNTNSQSLETVKEPQIYLRNKSSTFKDATRDSVISQTSSKSAISQISSDSGTSQTSSDSGTSQTSSYSKILQTNLTSVLENVDQSDLHVDQSCTKHPDHSPFIPMNNLKVIHLPEPFQKPAWKTFIELKAVDVVRLTVSCTSKTRPDQLGFKDAQGERYGTGTAFTQKIDQLVPCDCGVGASGHMRSLLLVMTVAHVVYDDEEALKTKVDFFYDSSDVSTIVTAHGLRVIQVDVVSNRSLIECWTHHLDLSSRLKQALLERNALIENELKEVGTAKMVVLISHPHGKCKQISFGSLKDMKTSGEPTITQDGLWLKECVLIYDTPTCPGTGGAPVNVMGGGYASAAFAPHSFSRGKSENFSGLGWCRVTRPGDNCSYLTSRSVSS